MRSYSYTGKPQYFTASTDGIYDITAYGVQGGAFFPPRGARVARTAAARRSAACFS